MTHLFFPFRVLAGFLSCRPWRIFSLRHHRTTALSAEDCAEPDERFLRVLQYYLAGWHIKPKGVKKPCVLAPFPPHRIKVEHGS